MPLNKETKAQELETILGAVSLFDLKKRSFITGGNRGILYYIIGYTDALLTERILNALQQIPENTFPSSPEQLMEERLPFAGVEILRDPKKAADEILRGSLVFVIEPLDGYLIADTRSFSVRSTEEPEKDKTLRGPHVGFTESLVGNLIQIRRYLRTETLQTERFVLGSKIRNEVVLLSIKGRADERLLKSLRKKLESADIPALSMTQETLANTLFPTKGLSVLNPFPKVRYTERPDVVAATLMEGKCALICDNSPSVLLLPECLFDFFEEADDYYFPPVTATYLRLVRGFVFLTSIFLIPIWLLLVQYANRIPTLFQFILTEESYSVPLFLQFLIIELALDGLKMASLNTPSTLSNSFSVIGGLLLGEFAVKSGWFVPQTILYSAFTGIANYVPTNYELGYSFKFMRISLILLVEFFGIWGLIGGTLIWLMILFSTRSIAGKRYLYPFLPFDRKAVLRLFFRHRSGREKTIG